METHPLASSPTIPGSIVGAPPSASQDLDQLNEAQLREAYEIEEIERFLRLFSTYVNEVAAPEVYEASLSISTPSKLPDNEGEGTHSEGETSEPTATHELRHYDSISEGVAYRLLLPHLPPLRAPPQEFTLNRFRLAAERVYLAIVPNYYPFLLILYRLAKWQDQGRSTIFCAGFWILWWQDLLLAAFFLNLILILLKHNFFPYPSLSELKQRRKEIYRADRFSEQLSQRLSAPSVFGIGDLWKFGRPFVLPPKDKKYITKLNAHSELSPHSDEQETVEPVVFHDTGDSREIQEMKQLGLFLMNETADFHERVKNVFTWRRPKSSWLYFCLLSCLFVASILLPTRYLSRIIFGILGFAFWHITPVLLALTPEERLRLPAPMSDVPTDAEYAMEMISQRVAAGLPITPSRPSKGKRPTYAEPSPAHTSNLQGSAMFEDQFNSRLRQSRGMSSHVQGMEKAIDSGKSFFEGSRRFISKMQTPSEDDKPSFTNLVNPPSTTYTYPAQHTSAPGLITFTPSTLYFSPVTSVNYRLSAPLQDIQGVKKIGVLKGLEILYTEIGPDGQRINKAERFRWVYNRDELFARLVSANSRMKWVNA